MATETKLDTASELNSTKLASYFTSYEWVIYFGLVVVGLILRWAYLDMRPYHHDESLHGMYGRYFYDFPDANYYKYDPMLHGPMLYNSMRAVYAMMGDSLYAARTPVCLMGSLFILLPLLFRRFFTPCSTIILTGVIALSPNLVYWSRFLREDYWVVSGMMMMVYGALLAPTRTKALWVLVGLVIQWCTKENFFVSFSVLVGYFVFEGFFKSLIDQNFKSSLLCRFGRFVSDHIFSCIAAFIAAALVYSWFYGAGFRFPQGIIDGLGKKGFDYWSHQDGIERIKGPFNFHLYVLGWYELPFAIALITHIVLFYRRASLGIQLAGGVTLLALCICCGAAGTPSEIESNSFWKLFKLKDHYDIAGLFILLAHAPLVTIQHLIRKQDKLAVTGYLFTANLFVYSYLGEKVPWLVIYPLAFGIVYLTLYFTDYFKSYPVDYKSYSVEDLFLWGGTASMILGLFFIVEEWTAWSASKFDFSHEVIKDNSLFLALGITFVIAAFCNSLSKFLGTVNIGRALTVFVLLFTLRASIQTNFLYTGKENEYLSQVHTTYEVDQFARQVIDEVKFERNAYAPKVLVTGDATWPLTWYFRSIPDSYKFTATAEEKQNFTYIIQDYKDEVKPGDIPEGYYVRKMNLRGWWVPDFSQMTLRKFLRYSINHYVWGGSGFTYVTLLTAKDTSRFKK